MIFKQPSSIGRIGRYETDDMGVRWYNIGDVTGSPDTWAVKIIPVEILKQVHIS
jgi:hypothetical protein